MCSLNKARVRTPPSSLERSGVKEGLVQGDESLADTICDVIEVTGSQLIGYEAREPLSATFTRNIIFAQEKEHRITYSSTCMTDMAMASDPLKRLSRLRN